MRGQGGAREVVLDRQEHAGIDTVVHPLWLDVIPVVGVDSGVR